MRPQHHHSSPYCTHAQELQAVTPKSLDGHTCCDRGGGAGRECGSMYRDGPYGDPLRPQCRRHACGVRRRQRGSRRRRHPLMSAGNRFASPQVLPVARKPTRAFGQQRRLHALHSPATTKWSAVALYSPAWHSAHLRGTLLTCDHKSGRQQKPKRCWSAAKTETVLPCVLVLASTSPQQAPTPGPAYVPGAGPDGPARLARTDSTGVRTGAGTKWLAGGRY